MKNIRKFEMMADKDAAIIEECSVSYVNEENKVYTTPENGGQSGDTVKNYMRFVAVEDSVIKLNAVDYNTWEYVEPTVNLMVNKNNEGWAQYDFNPIPLSAGDTLYLKGDNQNMFSVIDIENWTGVYYSFGDIHEDGNGSTGKFECHGNIMSLLYGDDFEDKTSIQSVTCFYGMFSGCTSMTTAPELPATTLVDSCYWRMFDGCTNLTTAPELPATTLAYECYDSMFQGCTSLTTAPELPATTLTDYCYNGMFYGCTNLTTAPELPATTLVESCYSNMFQGCTSLTTAPELPATTLTDYCYYGMFYGCTNLTTAPELPATTLVESCYSNMFEGCTSLSHITMLATDISANYCLEYWVDGVAPTGTFIKSSEIVTLPIGSSGVPSGWTIENKFECEAVSLSITADNVDFYMTSTTIHYECLVNLYNKDGELVDTITVTGNAQSEPFPENTSETDIVERTISFTFYGKTATTTISQGKYNPYYSNYTTFEALEDGTFSFAKEGIGDDIQYSKDNGVTWTSLASNETVSVVTGDKVMWKSTITPSSSYPYGIGTFKSSNKFNVCGNIMSLKYDDDDFVGQTSLKGKNHAFSRLFWDNSGLIDASNLILPATTLARSCYMEMFSGCTSLTTAPELPATTLVDSCYWRMFDGCTNLTTAPELPATALVYCCYYGMFSGCTSMTTAPELPATTLAHSCYMEMFFDCTSLTTTPELPVTRLAQSCYNGMFQYCTSLTTAPELPATTLAENCYDGMFQGCTSLTTAPELPATILAEGCYSSMFYGCTSLTTAPELPVTILAKSCYSWMFDDCTSLTTAPELPATTLAENCYDGMFQGCTSLTTAPELPATTLAEKCYYFMFDHCTSLTTAPELPATTLAKKCYYCMFQGCRSLNHITMLATDISATDCLSHWVANVSSTGTFVKHPNMTSLSTGIDGIPRNWTVEDAVL